MHVCQIMLVEAESPEQAFSIVEDKLNDGEPRWADWHNAGAENMNFAGRWAGQVFASLNPDGTTKDVATTPNHLRYSDDPALAEEVLTRYLEQRMAEIRNYKAQAADLASTKYDPYVDKIDMPVWYAQKLAQLLGNDWTPDSAIYDLEDWTASLAGFVKRVATNADQQFLIPIDFHF